MKKLLLASAVAALSVSAANAAPTVYGKVFLSLDAVDSDFTDSTDVELNSTASRIGLKGSEALTGNTDVIYQLEYVVNPDDKDGDQFESRDTYIGFANNTVGTFKFGRNSSVTDGINNVQQAFGGIQGTVSGIADGNRVDNSMIWTAPTANLPVQLNLMASTEENNGDAGYGASVMFDQGTGYTLAVAYTDKMEGGNLRADDFGILEDTSLSAEVLRATATYDMAKTMGTPLKLGVMYQQAEWNDAPARVSEKEKELMVTAAYDVVNTPWTVWAEFDQAKDFAGINDADVTKIAVGGRYAFTKAATGHLYAGNTKFEGGAKLGYAKDKGDEFMVGTGIEYKF